MLTLRIGRLSEVDGKPQSVRRTSTLWANLNVMKWRAATDFPTCSVVERIFSVILWLSLRYGMSQTLLRFVDRVPLAILDVI